MVKLVCTTENYTTLSLHTVLLPVAKSKCKGSMFASRRVASISSEQWFYFICTAIPGMTRDDSCFTIARMFFRLMDNLRVTGDLPRKLTLIQPENSPPLAVPRATLKCNSLMSIKPPRPNFTMAERACTPTR